MRTPYGHETLQLNTHAKTRLLHKYCMLKIYNKFSANKQAFIEKKACESNINAKLNNFYKHMAMLKV